MTAPIGYVLATDWGSGTPEVDTYVFPSAEEAWADAVEENGEDWLSEVHEDGLKKAREGVSMVYALVPVLDMDDLPDPAVCVMMTFPSTPTDPPAYCDQPAAPYSEFCRAHTAALS